ncbi:MAG: hypothetical protein WKF83_04520 [Nocardioidaceae bacterium]
MRESSRPLVGEIDALRTELGGRGFDHVVLCGMGGSSLAPEVICNTAGVELTVLDSSHPDYVSRAVADRLERTVVVVSSKSGGTVETDSQKRTYEQAFADIGHDPADHIVVVTDPGSPLDESAREAGYRGLQRRPRGRRPLLGADRLRPGPQRAGRCRHRWSSRRGLGDRTRSRRRLGGQPRTASRRHLGPGQPARRRQGRADRCRLRPRRSR